MTFRLTYRSELLVVYKRALYLFLTAEILVPLFQSKRYGLAISVHDDPQLIKVRREFNKVLEIAWTPGRSGFAESWISFYSDDLAKWEDAITYYVNTLDRFLEEQEAP